MLKTKYAYIALFSYDDEGIAIEFPDLPGCLSCAENTDDALKNAKEAMGLHLFGMEQDNDPIPDPTPLTKIECEKNTVPVLIDVFMPPVRERIKTRFVKKTLSLPADLAAEADESGVNCSKLFQKALIEYLHGNTNNSVSGSSRMYKRG